MRHDFPVELRTEDNFVLASARQGLLFVIARIPDPRFTHEVESRLMEHGGFVTLNIAPEKNCGPEDSLEGGDQTTVLGATLLHPQRVEHLGPLLNRIVWHCCRTASVARKIGTSRSCPQGRP